MAKKRALIKCCQNIKYFDIVFAFITYYTYSSFQLMYRLTYAFRKYKVRVLDL